MAMQPIVMKVALFRGDWDQARSQYSLLWLMEALVRINQSHIRQFRGLAKQGKVPAPYPPLYRSGVHYEPEAGTEEWLDIPTVLDVPGGTFPGPWGDCEDLACWRAAELREDPHHPIKAKPFAKWRKKADGAYAYHALTLLPTGKLEDPSLVLGMGNEPEFARLRMAERYKEGSMTPKIRYAKAPQVVVVDPEKDSGYGKDTERAKRETGLDEPPAGAPVDGMVTGRIPPGSPPRQMSPTSAIKGRLQFVMGGDTGDDIAAWGYDEGDVDLADMRELREFQRSLLNPF